MRTLLPLCVVVGSLGGCASAPPATGQLQAAVAESPAATAPAEATAPPAESGAAEGVKVKPKVPAGYRAATHDGALVYCKDVETLGSRFKKEVCVTPEQYKELEASSERNRQDLRKATSTCGGGTGYGSCSGG